MSASKATQERLRQHGRDQAGEGGASQVGRPHTATMGGSGGYRACNTLRHLPATTLTRLARPQSPSRCASPPPLTSHSRPAQLDARADWRDGHARRLTRVSKRLATWCA
jgi:hypothetical protein